MGNWSGLQLRFSSFSFYKLLLLFLFPALQTDSGSWQSVYRSGKFKRSVRGRMVLSGLIWVIRWNISLRNLVNSSVGSRRLTNASFYFYFLLFPKPRKHEIALNLCILWLSCWRGLVSWSKTAILIRIKVTCFSLQNDSIILIILINEN